MVKINADEYCWCIGLGVGISGYLGHRFEFHLWLNFPIAVITPALEYCYIYTSKAMHEYLRAHMYCVLFLLSANNCQAVGMGWVDNSKSSLLV